MKLEQINSAKPELFFSHHGEFNHTLLTKIADYLYDSSDIEQSIKRKVFKVSIEMIQNVQRYSYNRSEEQLGIGLIEYFDQEKQILIKTKNLVDPNNIDKITQRCEEIRSLSREELRKLKNKIKNRDLSEKGGNIGLLTILLLSRNPFDWYLEQVDADSSFIIFEAQIDK